MIRITRAACGKTSASPMSTKPKPRYIGLRTNRYGSVITSRRGGSKGAGVPSPRHANSHTQGRAMTAPIATTSQPIGRGSSNACGPANHRGTRDAQNTMKAGATTSARSRAKTLRPMLSTCYLRSGMSTLAETPVAHTDPVNAQILSISEDRIAGFVRDPIGEIAERSGVDVDTVIERIRAMLRAGTIRRVRQTLMATNLAEGALVAWQLPNEKIDAAFDWMFREDPFSGHVVIRSTDAATAGSHYRLWTTVKAPQGFSIEKHCATLARLTSAERY